MNRRRGGASGVVDKVLDVITATVPCASSADALMTGSPHETFLLKRNAGLNDTKEFKIDEKYGYEITEEEMKIWADGDQILVQRLIAPNTGNYYEQTNIANMPVLLFADPLAGNQSVLNRDSLGRVSLWSDGNRAMSMPGSVGLFNLLTNGTHCSQFFGLQHDVIATPSYYMWNRPASGTVGVFGGVGRYFSNNNTVSMRVASPVNHEYYTRDISTAPNVGQKILTTINLNNATTADKIITVVNGTTYKSNIVSTTLPPSTSNASFDMNILSNLTSFKYYGSACHWLFFNEQHDYNEVTNLII
jgi:hypothetical protein